jgi:hypothetical protein
MLKDPKNIWVKTQNPYRCRENTKNEINVVATFIVLYAYYSNPV